LRKKRIWISRVKLGVGSATVAGGAAVVVDAWVSAVDAVSVVVAWLSVATT